MINKFKIFEALQKLDDYPIETITKIYLKIIEDINIFVKNQNNRETITNLLKDLTYPDNIKKIILCEIIDKVNKGSEAYNEIYLLLNSTKGKLPKQQKKTSYVWQNNPDSELPELYSLMIKEYKLIAAETTYEQFKAVFTGQPIDSINPMKWHQDNASELLYFIDKLEQSNNIEHNPKRADYQKLTACFVKPDGKPFNAVWKSLKTNIAINLSPDKQKAIDELVNNF
jgi:hypothetical protein